MFRGAVVCALLATACAASFNSPLEDKPDRFKDEPGCFISALDKVVPVDGTEASPTECIQYRCDNKWYDIYTCGVVAGEPPCETVTDATKPYPDCCPRIQCPETLEAQVEGTTEEDEGPSAE